MKHIIYFSWLAIAFAGCISDVIPVGIFVLILVVLSYANRIEESIEKSANKNEKLLKDILIEFRKNKRNVPNIPSNYNLEDISLEQAKEILEKINRHF